MEAIKLCRLDTPIIFIEARINLSRFVVTGCAAKTSATVTFPSLNLISLFAFCFNIWLRSEERFSRNAETDLVCRLLLEKKKNDPEIKTDTDSEKKNGSDNESPAKKLEQFAIVIAANHS